MRLDNFKTRRMFLFSIHFGYYFNSKSLEKVFVVQLNEYPPKKHYTIYFSKVREYEAANRFKPIRKLAIWFATNWKRFGAFHIKYVDFPSFFTWTKCTKYGKFWSPRATFQLWINEIPEVAQLLGSVHTWVHMKWRGYSWSHLYC